MTVLVLMCHRSHSLGPTLTGQTLTQQLTTGLFLSKGSNAIEQEPHLERNLTWSLLFCQVQELIKNFLCQSAISNPALSDSLNQLLPIDNRVWIPKQTSFILKYSSSVIPLNPWTSSSINFNYPYTKHQRDAYV